MKRQYMGWTVAAAIAGALAGSGFQAKGEKYGVVDLITVFSDSEFKKTQSENLRTIGTQRQDLLQFANTYPLFTVEEAQRFRDLSIKVQPTSPEKAELEKLKKDAIALDKKFKTLQLKTNPNADEVALLKEYSERTQNMAKTIDRWAREFTGELEDLQDKYRRDTLDRVKQAVQDVGQKQGYSVIYVQDIVPYSANNLTADSLKAMNSKK